MFEEVGECWNKTKSTEVFVVIVALTENRTDGHDAGNTKTEVIVTPQVELHSWVLEARMLALFQYLYARPHRRAWLAVLDKPSGGSSCRNRKEDSESSIFQLGKTTMLPPIEQEKDKNSVPIELSQRSSYRRWLMKHKHTPFSYNYTPQWGRLYQSQSIACYGIVSIDIISYCNRK